VHERMPVVLALELYPRRLCGDRTSLDPWADGLERLRRPSRELDPLRIC